MPFARGFKTRCENIAQATRVALERRPDAPLTVTELADYLGVGIIGPEDISGMPKSVLRVLLEDEADDWSALTVGNANRVVIIYNPQSSPGRYSSDISHELSHLILRHSPSTLMFAPDGKWTLRSYDSQQEEEAAWLSGCLLLPRPALLRIVHSGLSLSEAAKRYKVSERMLTYRRDITGVVRQVKGMRSGNRRRRKRS